MCPDLPQLKRPETADDDLRLVHATKSGDVTAFEELVKRYDRKLLRIAQNVMQNHEDAEEVVQESFLKAFLHLDQFREDAKFSTWLIRIAMNQSLMMLRKTRSARTVSIDTDDQSEERSLPIDVADWAPNPEQLYRTAELHEILRHELKQLHPGLRVVFVLRDVEGLSIQQTAEALNLSVAAVKARSWRGRIQLRERLSKYFRRSDAREFANLQSDSTLAKHSGKSRCELNVSSFERILPGLQTSFDKQVTRREHRFAGPRNQTSQTHGRQSSRTRRGFLAVKRGTQHNLERAECNSESNDSSW